ncbi:MupG family TIM beta-alpha barrel fold protein [Vagococcus carniphilus]|uniref:MupG family TIM beta-alpha barrel fold protein n=1 Tax=Vagococcus carniphilus TaxID=218144 RepID=A0AAW8UBB0_9ENTE|nr:MupG family TIM beta-alpha barrel fold protein [Vagococcus carniphilus]MDT2830126.1 MupG family TIM beta-alpha barrel fold protein [Vagococcus carniphilus]MDT2835266.1 MupG family TIM beta-alpha barrel fold protein [Vagococcus carniphilus]MDT2838558.1 MupG family TIM beta-alpha barrel fold protein [Vagococcus carniphilus]MDT2853396.1 MupG family TIM beta-alpha barrel fold protein [Vagococcus carniphilus]
MFGFSVFLGSDMSEETKEYIIQMSQNGFNGIFTSMHIPEDDSSKYLDRITLLGDIAKKNNLNLMVDISSKALSTLGLDIKNDTDKVRNLGITGLRMDYGIPMETIANASKNLTIGLNASTLSSEDVLNLKKYGADFSNMEFWHNYYPRKETGLSKKSFIDKNKWLKELGGKIIAFSPGNKILRGPLFDSLPTLEKHRFAHPLAASIELLAECLVDEVYIGDEQIKIETINQFRVFQNEKTILLHSNFISNDYQQLLTGEHTNRMDVARDVIRSQEARFKEIPTIKQINTIDRAVGSITLDNHLYGRYMGELQITKTNLTADSRVNVMGRVIDEDIPLIDWIKAGQKYQFIGKD